MTSYIVVFGLIVVVVLVVVLVALGLRASRAGRDDDDWMDDEPQKQPRGRRGAPPQEPMGGPDEYGPGYNDGYDGGYDEGYDGGYDRAPEPVPDRRVAGGGGPLAAPTSAPAPPPPPPGPASDEMEDDDYWATITFDKPKFPWQHDHDGDRPESDPAADPLNAQAPPPEQPPAEPPNLTQPVSMGADGTVLNGLGGGTGPQQMPAGPGGFQGGPAFPNNDPGATSLDPIPADLAGPGVPGGPQAPYGVPDQPAYGGQEPQPAYGAADYGPGDPSYGDPSYGGQDQYGSPEYGSPEPSYGDYNADPLGNRPAAGPPPGGRTDFDRPGAPPAPGGPLGGDPRVSDPLGLPLGRPEEPPPRPLPRRLPPLRHPRSPPPRRRRSAAPAAGPTPTGTSSRPWTSCSSASSPTGSGRRGALPPSRAAPTAAAP
ncbi:hypothetical protein [Actinomadura madurae]|uniref:hypothetical protein n=1 Tax=Actinomadura madurae TaxID=1993 RepID=UPI0020D25AA2|nr:hypothetical protein [Actinomadura madurae]MCQ0014717.1 hypothetical protein [Actinomadura madurae]